ncbi:hypothetical protein [Rubrivivax gelatinosus]|uniref:hypothetical protein n=1 Tax=Rubrivivax gelatinosus TaxID=28068 RepID=UPI000681A3AC|nr:hypothetical protein [Rubrivivax gelatinosus]MBG6083124.1 hypothetical protein [Rubrivivax gelatinosus]
MSDRVALPHAFLFLDTQFTDFAGRHPLSVGIAGQDGRTLYVELTDTKRDACTDFVVTQVLPLMGSSPAVLCNYAEAGSLLREWLAPYQGRDVVLVHDCVADREILFDLLHGGRGGGRRVIGGDAEHESFRRLGRDLGLADLLPMDVGQRVNQAAIEQFFDLNPRARRHRALDNALALMAAFLAPPAGAASGGVQHGE